MSGSSYWTRTQVTQLYQHHAKHPAPGIHWDHIEVDDLEPAPLPGGARRGDWRWEHPPQGPVSTLLENVHWMASTLSLPSFTLRSKYDHTIHVLSDPFQHIRPSLHTHLQQGSSIRLWPLSALYSSIVPALIKKSFMRLPSLLRP